MTLTNLFQIDGKSLYAPDCDIEPSYSDLDSSDSGRDEAGYMHREVVREKVATWPIAYSCLTDDEFTIRRAQPLMTWTMPGFVWAKMLALVWTLTRGASAGTGKTT